MSIEANKVIVGRDFLGYENFQKGQYVALFTEMKSFQTRLFKIRLFLDLGTPFVLSNS